VTTSPLPELDGLVLVGGRSTRMGADKAALRYRDRPQAAVSYDLLSRCCARVFLSRRRDQVVAPDLAQLPQLDDVADNLGPMGGIISALQTHPGRAWLVVACDLPFLTEATLRHLISQRDPARLATAYRSAHDGQPEPLCAIYEPAIAAPLQACVARGALCPRRALADLGASLLDLPDPRALDNINHPQEYAAARTALGSS
jgi:molybdenum cofactor guanylyltransferase